MNTRAAIISAALCVFGAVTVLTAQTPYTKTKSVTGTATIQAIDTANRTVTLRDESGVEDTYTVGPDVKRFGEFKVGDKIKMTYYESLVMTVRKPGDPAPAADPATTAGVTRGQGAMPSATIAAQDKMTVTVKAIDPATPSVTVTTSDGRTITRKVEDKKNLEKVKVGDVIDITYTRALLTSLERGK